MASFASYLAGTQAVVFARATQAPARTLYSTFQQAIVSISLKGGSPMYKRNVAAKVPFKAVDSSNAGVPALTITTKTAKDGANPAPTTNAVVESGSGWYYVTLTATEMDGEIVVLDPTTTTSGVTLAPIAIHTEADYTVARAAHLDADISSRSTYAGADTSGTTTLLARVTSTRAGNLDNLDAAISSRSTFAGGAVASVTAPVALTSAYDSAKTAAQAGDAMALTSGERTTLAASIWGALTSALTTVGSIGKLLVDRIDAAISSRLAGGSYTAPDNASIAAVKAKTDNLPSDPADASDIASAFSTIDATLATMGGYIDTEVAAIKAKTDNLPASPASSGDVSTLGTAVAAVDAKLGTPAGASVSADVAAAKADTAAIKTKTDQLAFTVPNKVDANIRAVNDVNVTGSGAPSDPWGP